jgi:hypothetical protein
MPNPLTAPSATATARTRRAALGALALLAVTGLIAWAGQWSAAKEARSLTEAMARDMDVHALALRGAAANFNYPKSGSYPVAGNTSGVLNGPRTGAILSLT